MTRLMKLPLPLLLLLSIVPFSSANSLIFYPPKASYSDSPDIIKIEVENNESISAMYKPNSESQYTLLFSHGNAEDIGQNLSFYKLCQKNGFSVFAYDYRGYGTSDGQPSEFNTYKDILAAYHYLVKDLKTDPNNIIVHGRSLGSGPSCYLASQKPVGALVLESAFTSIHRVAFGASMPLDPYNNLGRIKNIKCPVLVIHGKKDSVIPILHGATLHREANSPKIKYWIKSAGHNDLLQKAGNNYWKTLRKFENLIKHTKDKKVRKLPDKADRPVSHERSGRGGPQTPD